jgi:Tfp pilus assembly protein PilO
MKLKKDTKYFLDLAIISLVLVAILLFVIYPAIRNIIDTNRQINDEKFSLETKLYNQIDIEKAKKQLDDIKGSLSQLDGSFVIEGQELDFVSNLESLAASRQTEITIDSDFNYTKGLGIKVVPVQINAKGNYKSLILLLHDIESLPYYYNFNQISLSGGEGQNASLEASGQIYLKSGK